MPKAAKEINLKDVIEIVLRRRWWIIISFFLSMIVGILLALTLPRIYTSKALILIQPQKLPDNYVRSVVTTDNELRLNILSKQVMGRSNLEKIIQDFNLFTEPKYESMFIEDKIDDLRERITIELISRDKRLNWQGDEDAFSVSVEDRDPEKALKITNALTSYIIDENLRARETEAIGTSDFIREEMDFIRVELAEKEQKLKEYREKYMGGLPEQLGSNLRMLDRLQERLTAKQAGLLNAKNRLEILESQISEGAVSLNRGSEEPLSLEEAKAMLAYFETRYTEKHPDVIRLKKMISDLKEKDEKDNNDASNKSKFILEGSQYIPMNLRIKSGQIKTEIVAHEADISNLISQIPVYQRRVDDTPKREQELYLLERDYKNIKKTYDVLLSKKMETGISINMEKKQQGEQFQIIQGASLPEKPTFPNMKLLFILTLAAGLNIGLGLVLLLEYLNTSFRSPEDIESYLNFSVIATLPKVYHEKDKRKQKLNQAFGVFSIILSCILLVVFAMLTFKGVDQTMELLTGFITTTTI